MGEYDNAAAWNTAGQLAGTAGNAMAAASTNRRTRKWNEEMMDRQRSWALEDWNRQNEYNLPANQMQRLKDAGLNPHLIYGNGNVTVASTQPIKSSGVQSWNPKPVDFSGIGNALSQYFQIQLSQAQLDNLRVQKTVMEQEALNKETERKRMEVGMGLTGVQTDRAKFDLELAKDLRSTDILTRTAALNKLNAETQFTLNEDERKKLSNTQSLAKGVEEIALIIAQRENLKVTGDEIRARIDNLVKDGTLKQLEIDLKNKNLTWSDPYYIRVGAGLGEAVLRGISGNTPRALPSLGGLLGF